MASKRTKYTAKKGDSLQDLEMRLYDRDELPMDLTNASEVRLYMQDARSGTAAPNYAMEVLPAQADETYPQRIRGTNTPLATAGTFFCYVKATYPTKTKRVPSDRFFSIEVEETGE